MEDFRLITIFSISLIRLGKILVANSNEKVKPGTRLKLKQGVPPPAFPALTWKKLERERERELKRLM